MRISRKEAKALGLDVGKEAPRKKGKGPAPFNCPLPGPGLGDGNTGCDPLFDKLCEAHGLPLPDHEVEFIPGRKFKADYLFEGWLVVEKDGGLYGIGPKCKSCGRRPPSHHSSIKQMKSDREKDRLAVLHGYSVIRFLPEEFEDGSAFAFIKEILIGGPQ